MDILPKGATATIHEPGEQVRSLPLTDGVLATVAPTSTQIRTDVAGRVTTIDLPPSTIGAYVGPRRNET